MVNIAILGFGVVGSGVAEVLADNATVIAKRCGHDVAVKYILDIRPLGDSPFASCWVNDFSVIEQDETVDVVVETIGGATVALDFTRRALMAGKSVVSSNKELVAKHGCQLLALAKANNVSYLFEASVGGGIPILRPLAQCLAGNEITEICGILNGTTNFILTQMIKNGLSFETALKDAQARGYAEQDPTADVEGHDACRKICILSDIAFGHNVSPDQVPTTGIGAVTLADVAYGEFCHKKIKLVGRSVSMGDGKICAYVAPHVVAEGHPLAGVEDVFNAVAVTGNAVGQTMFYGPGAGKRPTASAVVADVMDIVGRKPATEMVWTESVPDMLVSPDTLSMGWYVRGQGAVATVKEALPQCQILSRNGAPSDEWACLTAEMTRPELMTALAGVAVLTVMPLLD